MNMLFPEKIIGKKFYYLGNSDTIQIRQQNEILHIFYSFNIFNAMFWE